MQFQVPQFIETEDKIIGGILTLKQFLIIAAGAGISFIFYFLFDTFVWLFMTTIIGVVAVGAAFLKIQGRSVPIIILAAIRYYWNPRFYLWRSEPTELPNKNLGAEAEPATILSNIKTVLNNTEAPKQFAFHKKTIKQKISTPSQNKIGGSMARGVVKENETKVEAAPLSWPKTSSAESSHPGPNTTIASPEAPGLSMTRDSQVFKKEKLLERERAESENAQAGLESERRRLAKEINMPAPKAAPIGAVPPRTKENFSAATRNVAEEKSKAPKESGNYSDKAREAAEDVGETLLSIRHQLATAGGRVQALFQKLSTSKTSLPKREKSVARLGHGAKEQLELLRKATGELEIARRVDYSDSRHQ